MITIPIHRLHTRRAELTKEREKEVANLNAIAGALQLLDELIAAAQKEAAEAAAKPGSEPPGAPRPPPSR